MTGLAIRRARILKVRKIEHRLATAQAQKALSEVSTLKQIEKRLIGLRSTLTPDDRIKNGRALQSMHEMAELLEGAKDDLAVPIGRAEAKAKRCQGERTVASARENSVEKLQERAEIAEEYRAICKADAERPFRRQKFFTGDRDGK